MSITDKIRNRIEAVNSILIIGLDTDYDKIPSHIKKNSSVFKAVFNFNKAIIDATQDLAVGYKLNYVCYSSLGLEGLKALEKTNRYIHKKYPGIIVILDCKKNENVQEKREMARKEVFDWLDADLVTVLPWMGYDALEVLLEDREKGVLLICRNSNPSSSEIQDLKVKNKPLYELCAELAAKKWNKKNNLLIEAPTTFPKSLKRVRKIIGEDMIILTLGVGSQGGKLKDIKGGMNKQGNNLLFNKGRNIIFASPGKKFATAARLAAQNLKNEVNRIRLQA